MVEKLTLNYLATALLDISAVSMPVACSLNSQANTSLSLIFVVVFSD